MNRLILTNKWLIQCLGLLALALLVWFVGPWVGTVDGKIPLESGGARGLTIAAIWLIWVVWHFAWLAWSWHKDRELFKKINEADPKSSSRKEAAEKLDVLRAGFEDAVKVLRESRAKNSQHGLYELPWYVIIGAPGTGKTTALVNSGLKFPLSSKSDQHPLPVKGIGGTRNCDWWFTDEAVLLDTAGRYVTQDSHQEVDEKEWQGFLALLKEYRPKRPLNGILVASSLADFLQQTDEQARRHAETLRRRILELHRALGVRIPIYLLFTKVDLVAGFNEFFADFGLEERKQVWGETFPIEDAQASCDWLNRFDAGYDALLKRLDLHTYPCIQAERNIQRRSLVLGFPQQMVLLKPAILDFLEAVFASNRYENSPLLLRGVYFACGTQEGHPIDRLMGILANAFRLDKRVVPVFSGQGKSFFLNRLLKGVVFPEAELAGVDSSAALRERILQWGVWGGFLALSWFMVGLWWISFSLNQAAIKQTDEQIKLYREGYAQPKDTRANFKLLQVKLDALLRARDTWRDTGWLSHFGLHQTKLGSAAEDAYKRLLRDSFMQALIIRLQERLQAAPDVSLLKAYRMLGKSPDWNWQQFDANTLEEVFIADWAQLFNADEEAFSHLKVHLKNMLELKQEDDFELRLKPYELDKTVKTEAVRQLTQVGQAQRCYDGFKHSKFDPMHDFKLSEALGPNGQKAFLGIDGKDSIVPALFTSWGYREFVLLKSAAFVQGCMVDNWVLDEPASGLDSERLYEQFMVLYTDEYAEKWRKLLSGIKPVSVQNLRQTAELLDILSRPDSSPLRLLLAALESNTALGKVPAVVSDVMDKAKLQKIPGLDVGAIIGRQVAQMEKSFDPLNVLVRAGADKSFKSVPLDSTLERAKELGHYFLRNSSGEQAQQNVASHSEGGGDAVDQARMEFKRLPAPLQGWLMSLTTGGFSETLSKAKEALRDKAKSMGLSGSNATCSAAFSGRYPFVRTSLQDTPQADFIRFFSPNGVIDQFFQQNLKGFVDTGAATWRQKSAEVPTLGLSQDAIHQFQAADKIRSAYFPSGGQALEVQFMLKLLELSPGVESFRFNFEGQDIVYRSGQVQADLIRWPGSKPGTGIQFSFETPDKQQITSLRKTGPWALFRVLEESSLKSAGGPELFHVIFQAGGFVARFELQALSLNNPFSLGDSRNFHCPEVL